MTPGPEGLPPSFAQQRLWFLDRLAPDNPAANLVVAYRLSGVVNVPALRDAFTEVVSRHEALRTGFIETADGPRQVVGPPYPVAVAVQDVSALADPAAQARREVEAELRTPFNLRTGPLLRVRLFRLGEQDHVLAIAVHHIAGDAWSMGIFESELGVLYRAFAAGKPSPLAPLDTQYTDFARWQRSLLSEDVVNGLLGYWRDRLRSMPDVLELPVDRPRPPVPSYTAGMVSFDVPRAVAVRLRALAAELYATPYILLLTAFNVLLAAYTGGQDIVVTVPYAYRDQDEFVGLIGCLLNTLVLRVDCGEDPTVDLLVERVRETVLGALEHRDLPFEHLVQDLRPSRDASRNPLVQVGFQLLSQGHTSGSLDLAGLAVTPLEAGAGTIYFDLEAHCLDGGPDGGLTIRVRYAADLFSSSIMEQFAGHFANILAGLRPDARLSQLPLLTSEQAWQQAVEWNATEADFPAATVTRMFEAQVALTPRSTAVSIGGEKLTYGDLDARASQFAHRLRSRGAGPRMAVGLHMRPGLHAMIAVLAVFKAGGACLPLDPQDPPERVADLLADASCALMIVDDDFAADPAALGPGTVVVQFDPSADAAFPSSMPGTGSIEDLAYVIYPSVAAGTHTGVEITHGSVANMAVASARSLGTGPRSRVLQVTSLSGGIPGSGSWPTWVGGGELVIVPEQPSADELARVLAESRITHVTIDSSQLAALPDAALPDLRTIQLGAGSCPPAVVNRWAPGRTLINAYGPVEATCYAASFRCEGDISAPPPIGRPVSNTQLYILDRFLRLVPAGVTGEIYIGGVSLARGYRADPGLTSSRFIANPFEAGGSRLYRTGDLARYRPDGTIEFLARSGSQVKVRGFRVDLGEVESVIGEHPGVAQAAAAVHAERLFAYVVPAGRDGAGTAELEREHLQDSRRRFDQEHREGRTAQPPHPVAAERILALRPRRLLEIGCGAGALLRELLPVCGRYVATDFSPVAINQLRSQYAGESKLTLLARDATDFRGFQDGSFDAAVIDSVLRHLPGLHAADEIIRNTVSVLADGGILVITGIRKDGDTELTIDPAYFSGLPDRVARVAGTVLVDRQNDYDVVVSVAAPHPVAEPGEIAPGLANDPLDVRRAERLTRQIRDLARRRLPPHMIPAGVLIVDELPLSQDGTIDRQRLPVPGVLPEGGPRPGAGEAALCALFAEILNLEKVSPDDGFFDLGGHSLLVFRLGKLIRSRLGADISLETIFQEQTPAALAAYLNHPTLGEER